MANTYFTSAFGGIPSDDERKKHVNDINIGLKYNKPSSDPVSTSPYPTDLKDFLNSIATRFDPTKGGTVGSVNPDYGTITQSDISQKALNFLKQKTGYNFNIKASMPDPNSLTMAYFNSDDPQSGSNSPTNKTLFVNPSYIDNNKLGLGTIFHEAGHAVDPNLPSSHQLETWNPKTMDEAVNKNRINALEYGYQTGIQSPQGITGRQRVISETEAQRASGQFLNEFANQYPELNIKSKDYTSPTWYKDYPKSYAENSIDSFYYPEIKNLTPTEIDANTFIDNSSNAMKTITNDALDPKMQNSIKSIIGRASNYVDQRLNQYP